MPTYDYRATDAARSCDRCREPFEVVQSFADAALTACPACGAAIARVIGAPTFLTKGTKKDVTSDANLKRLGFKKLVNEGNGKFRNVLAD